MNVQAKIEELNWIAVDWGTSNLRAWAMDDQNRVLARGGSNKGMGVLAKSEFEPALLEVIETWLGSGRDIPVICCGMVGSRQGWIEAPYSGVPCRPVDEHSIVHAPVDRVGLSVHVIPGVKQLDPADVMRGEETQIAGLIKQQPDFEGVVCLPGTHTKWARIKGGQITEFTTFVTGEMFSLLTKKSVLRHSVSADGWDESAFQLGLMRSFKSPDTFSARLFSLRAESLIDDLDPIAARSRLSGLIIGMELCASMSYWQGQTVAIIGTDVLAETFARSLTGFGAETQVLDGEAMTLSGLTHAFNKYKEKS